MPGFPAFFVLRFAPGSSILQSLSKRNSGKERNFGYKTDKWAKKYFNWF